MVYNGDIIVKHGQKTENRKNRHQYFVTYRHLNNLFHEPVFPLSQFNHKFCFAVTVCFLCTTLSISREKMFSCVSAVI